MTQRPAEPHSRVKRESAMGGAPCHYQLHTASSNMSCFTRAKGYLDSRHADATDRINDVSKRPRG
jgi:hypothetical protein